MFGGKSGAHLVNSDGAGRIGFERIVGRAYLVVQPAFDGSITRQECTQAVADNFAFGGVLASPHLGFHYVRHLVTVKVTGMKTKNLPSWLKP